MQQLQSTEPRPSLSRSNNHQSRTSVTSASSIQGNGQLGERTALNSPAGPRLDERGNLLRYAPFLRGVSPTVLISGSLPWPCPLTGAAPSSDGNSNVRLDSPVPTNYHGRSVATRLNLYLPGGRTTPRPRPPMTAGSSSRAVEVFQAGRNSGYLARRRQMARQAASGAGRAASMMAAPPSTPSLSSSCSTRRLSQGPLVAAVAERAPTAAANDFVVRGGSRLRTQSAPKGSRA
jgi:hypothetical protein